MRFHPAVIYSAISGRLYCEDIGVLYSIFSHITGQSLHSHMLPAARAFAVDLLRERHAAIAAEAPPLLDGLDVVKKRL